MTRPQKPYTITFLPANATVQVDPARVPYDRHGKPGSILEIAMGHDVEIDHACGGVAACSTCHVVVKSGFESIAPAEEQEEDMLDTAPGLTPRSRLACQAVPSGACDIVVVVPSWNRNHAREGDH